MGEVSPEAVAGALENVYGRRDRCRELSQAAFSVARNPAWPWDRIAQRFDTLFTALVD